MATEVTSVVTDSCFCCPDPQIETRYRARTGTAICCGLPAPISGYGDALFSAFAYDTVYTVRTYEVATFPAFTEETCTRSRSRTGADYAATGGNAGAPSCPESEYTDSGCTDIYGVLPSCGNITPGPGSVCISNTESMETSSTTVDCSDIAVSAAAAAAAAIAVDYEDNAWTGAVSGMEGAESSYGNTAFIETSFEIRKVGYPVPAWIVLTIEVTDLENNVTYEEEQIFMPWGMTSTTFTLAASYGYSKIIADVKIYLAPKQPPPP